jgi:allantoin racemase
MHAWPPLRNRDIRDRARPLVRGLRCDAWSGEPLLVELACRAIAETSADVVILGGAPLAGLAAKVKDRIPVPVVDQVQAAVKQAEMLVALSVRKATAGTFRRPSPKATTGLDTALAARIEHKD